jgi:hypothetical protein
MEGWTNNVETNDKLEGVNPIQVVEYCGCTSIRCASTWWIGDALRHRDRIISKVSARYWEQTHKFGLLVPTTVKEELEIDQLTPKTEKEELEIDQLTPKIEKEELEKDQLTETAFWRKAVALKMKSVHPAFKFERVSVGYPL